MGHTVRLRQGGLQLAAATLNSRNFSERWLVMKVLVMSPWDAPIPLSRSWCVWEIFCTIATGSQLTITLAPAEQETFEATLLSQGGFESIAAAVTNIDAERAQAGDPIDKARIDETVKAELRGGFEELDGLIIKRIREWLVATGQVALDWLRSQEGDAVADSSILMSSLCTMMEQRSVSGRALEAESSKRVALAAVGKMVSAAVKLEAAAVAAAETADGGAVSETTSTAAAVAAATDRRQNLLLEEAVRASNLAATLTTLGGTERLDEALSLRVGATEATMAQLQSEIAKTGGVTPESCTLHAKLVGFLGETYYAKGQLKEAEQAFRMSLQFCEQHLSQLETHGDEGLETQAVRHQLGSLLMTKPPIYDCPGNHGLARFTAEQTSYGCDSCGAGIPRGTELFGCRTCDFDCCAECLQPGRGLDEAERLLAKVLEVRSARLGESNERTLMTQSNIAQLLVRRARAVPQPDNYVALLTQAGGYFRAGVRGFRKAHDEHSESSVVQGSLLAEVELLLASGGTTVDTTVPNV